MPFERRAGVRVWVDRRSVDADAFRDSLRVTVGTLLDADPTETREALEFELGDARRIRLERGGGRRGGSIPVPTPGPVASIEERVGQAVGCATIAWFSLERGWVFDARPDVAALELVVYDRRHRLTWEFVLDSPSAPRRRGIKSTLPVPDVAAAAAWYGRFLPAFGFGQVERDIALGACRELHTATWGMRLLPAREWPYDSSPAPSSLVEGSTGSRTEADPARREALTRRLSALGLSCRSFAAGLAVTDPFGFEWYCWGDRSGLDSEAEALRRGRSSPEGGSARRA